MALLYLLVINLDISVFLKISSFYVIHITLLFFFHALLAAWESLLICLSAALQLLKILLSKPTIPKLFARQVGWQGALSRLFICHVNTGSSSRWLTNSASASGHQLVLPLASDFRNPSLKRQRSASDELHSVAFDCGLDDDLAANSTPPKLQLDDFLADPYRRSIGDDDDEMEALQGMKTSESCTFSDGGSTPLMRSLSSTDWSQLRYAEADDNVASALKTMGLATTLECGSNGTDKVDQAEELCQNLLIVLFTIMWRGIDSNDESAWKVQHSLCWRRAFNLSRAIFMKTVMRQPPRQRTLDSYATAHPTVRSHRLRETFCSMRCAVCLELTYCVCHHKRLSVRIQILAKA